MIRSSWVFLLLVVPCLRCAAASEKTKAAVGESPESAAVKKLCEELGVATIKGDYAKVIDHTYDRVVKLMGGREKAIATIEAGMKQLKDKGFTLKAYNVGEPGEFLTESGNTFVVVPTRLELLFPGGMVIAKSYLLGISPDKGVTWKFADEAGIKDKKARDKILPKLPANLELPTPGVPKVIQDNKSAHRRDVLRLRRLVSRTA